MLTCDVAQRSLSALADGEAPDAPEPDVRDHVDACADCRGFDARIAELRQLLRFEPVSDDAVGPDLAPRVLARVAEHEHRRWWPAVAAAALVGAVAGATFAGIGHEPDTVAALDLPERVVEALPSVSTLAADITVRSGGDTWTGTLRYEAPESLAVVLHRAGDGARLATVADGDGWWSAGPRRCLPPAPAGCASPTVRAVEHRAPFTADAPVPLELVAPVDTLVLAGTLEQLGERAGLVGVRVTAGQVAGLLAGLDPTGALRPVHPTDPVDLWLDADHLVPVEVVVRAAETPERVRWAAAQGFLKDAGREVLRMELDDLVVDEPLAPDAFPAAPHGATTTDGGFEADDDPEDVPVPADLPVGMVAGRAGVVEATGVGVRTWSDGRAWIAVRATEGWDGGRLFGDPGPYVVPVDLGAAGTAYASADGSAVAVHTATVDVLVRGSVGLDVLRRAAASLGLVGEPVPTTWDEAATATLSEATTAAPDLLLPTGLDGFDGPAVRIDGGDVSLLYTGPGDRSFLVVRGAASTLVPPLDVEVVAVAVRGHDGRWRPATGDLEWVEDGHVRAIRSPTLGLAEVVAVAEGLRPT